MTIPDKCDKDLHDILSGMPVSTANSRQERMLAELHAECRAYRDTEFKVLASFWTITGFVLSANVLLVSKPLELPLVLIISASLLSVAFLILLASMVVGRLGDDKLIYQDLFRRIKIIREHWGVLSYYPTRANNEPNPITEGRGKGTQRNQSLVKWTTSFVVSIILVGLLAFLAQEYILRSHVADCMKTSF